MSNNRRDFLKFAGAAGIGMLGDGFVKNLPGFNIYDQCAGNPTFLPPDKISGFSPEAEEVSIIGSYGSWAAGLIDKELPSFSFRRNEWNNLSEWKKSATKRYLERLSMPDTGGVPQVVKVKEYSYDGLHIEELKWQLPYGSPTEAILIKPLASSGRLPGILAFHDHAGDKYFGAQKITKVSDNQHHLMIDHQKSLYEGRAWANELAKEGYVVLASDAFTFASRRVLLKDVPISQRSGLSDPEPEDTEGIKAYNQWAAQHESIMAKALFSAGTTWPGVFLAEDVKALDVLISREDVDPGRIGCCGLSGGGMRSVFLGGFDSRIKCAVPVGFMTTWRDLVLNKAVSHTWMTYVPLLPNELDFPEILGLRVPLPTLVLDNNEDPLFTNIEMHRADEMLKQVFEKAGAGNRYRCSFHPGPHKFDIAMQKEAFAWFNKWLKA